MSLPNDQASLIAALESEQQKVKKLRSAIVKWKVCQERDCGPVCKKCDDRFLEAESKSYET